MTKIEATQEQLKTARRLRDRLQAELDRNEADYLASLKMIKQMGIDDSNLDRATEKCEQAIKKLRVEIARYVEELDAILR